MKPAGVLSLVCAAILFFVSLSSINSRVNSNLSNMDHDFAAISTDPSYSSSDADLRQEQNSEMAEAIAGAVFLIAGIALVSQRRRPATAAAAATESF